MSLSELLLVDKPTGMTSFDVIRELRTRTGLKKFGHAGTLDPAASGLLLIGVGAGTKKLTDYIKLNKEYVTELALGERRDSGDLDGTIIETAVVDNLKEATARAELQKMTGSLRLPVSPYSAIKQDGVPMYKRARAAAKVGELIKTVPTRDMRVYEAEFLGLYQKAIAGVERPVVQARFLVGSGTYVRSLAEELGRRLGYPATVASLRRTKVGDFHVSQARKLTAF